MKLIRGKSIILVLTSLTLILLTIQCLRESPKESSQELKEAPDFKLDDMYGKPLSSSDLKGKVVILNFMETWCDACKAEFPIFNELQNKYKGHGVEIVAIAFDKGGVNVIRPAMEGEGTEYTVLIGTDNSEVVSNYGVRGLPTTFIITKDWRIYKMYIGPRVIEVYEGDIKELLNLS